MAKSLSAIRYSGAFALLATVAGMASANPPEPGFWLVGLPPSGENGQVGALNQDGSMAAGGNALAASVASFTWTQAGGRFDFGALPGMPLVNYATGLSDNGVVAGTTGAGVKSRAYRWAGSGPPQDLGVPMGTSRSFGTGVSGNGNVVVGYGESGSMGGFAGQAFRWTPASGMQGLGWLKPMSVRSQANGVSRDGSTIVGRNMDFNLTDEAFIWTEATGMQALPNLPNALLSAEAHAVNADGSVVVGDSVGPNNYVNPVRWTKAGVENLTVGSAFQGGVAYAVSDDGNVIGGSGWIWTPATKMMLASDYLALNGVEVPSGYKLKYVYTISGNGLSFGGSARNLLTNQTEGWVATIPAASSCPPDCDENGELNIDDFICFQTLFAIGDAKADCDQSGRLNIDDFICFQTAYAIGC